MMSACRRKALQPRDSLINLGSICANLSAATGCGGGFFIQCLLQLFLCLVVEFVVLARGLASVLPELVSSPDNVHFFGCGHAFIEAQSPLGALGTEGETTLGQNCSNPHSMQAMFQPL